MTPPPSRDRYPKFREDDAGDRYPPKLRKSVGVVSKWGNVEWSSSCFMRKPVHFWIGLIPERKIKPTPLFFGGIMKLLKSLLSLSLVAAAGLSLTACSDEDVAFGAGVVVGVIVSDGHGHHHRPNPPRYRGRRWHAEQLNVLSPAQTVALKYDLSDEQAEVLTAHLLPARQGDLSGLAALGFEKADLQALFDGKNPSASTLSTMSQKLGLSLGEAHQLIQNIKADALVARSQM